MPIRGLAFTRFLLIGSFANYNNGSTQEERIVDADTVDRDSSKCLEARPVMGAWTGFLG